MSKFRRQLIMASVPIPPPPPPPFYTTLGYVNDGLVAMWDGIYNAGTETHDGSATVWTDMVNGAQSAPLTSETFGDDYISVSTNNFFLISPDYNFNASTILPSRPYTIEMVAQEVTKSGDDNVASGVDVRNLHRLGIFRHKNNNAWGPAIFKVSNFYVAMSIDGLTYNQKYPKANKSFIVSNWTSVNSSNARNKVDVYYNGTLRSTHLYTFSSGSASTETETIRIAKSDSGSYRYFNIRIYNRTLTAEEIEANCAVDVQRFNITI